MLLLEITSGANYRLQITLVHLLLITAKGKQQTTGPCYQGEGGGVPIKSKNTHIHTDTTDARTNMLKEEREKKTSHKTTTTPQHSHNAPLNTLKHHTPRAILRTTLSFQKSGEK